MSMKASTKAQLWIAIAAIPLGALLWFFGLGIGLGAGSSLNPEDDWLMPISAAAFFGGPLIAIGGAVWLIVLAIGAATRKK
jgi:hypothetical protein